MDIDILTTDTQVSTFAKKLAAETVIAVDLEADALHNYREKICLIQISTLQRTVLIDPLAVSNLDPLKPIFASPAITKIFHAADYDLRSLKRDYDLNVYGLFDTMISAQFLGEERIGLADLLQKYFAIQLDKKFQKADWSMRPLPAEMVNYAAADTCDLHRLKDLLSDRLESLQRMSWVKEECALLEEVRFAENNGPLCLRFKGAGTLSRRELGVLENLLQWREGEGLRLNRPVYKVLGNKPLMELARRMPQAQAGMRGIEGLSPRLIERYGKAVLAAIAKGKKIPEDELPLYPRLPRKQKDPASEDRLKVLKKWREKVAKQYVLDPGVLINNAALESVAQAKPTSFAELENVSGLKNWQKEELGEGLLRALGKMS
jgi:ribonuclease D